MNRLPAYLLAAIMLPTLGVWNAAEGQAFKVHCPTGSIRHSGGPRGIFQECVIQVPARCPAGAGQHRVCPRRCSGGAHIDQCVKRSKVELYATRCRVPTSQYRHWKVVVRNGIDQCWRADVPGTPPKAVTCARSGDRLAIDPNGKKRDKCRRVTPARPSSIKCRPNYELVVKPVADICVKRVKPTFVVR